VSIAYHLLVACIGCFGAGLSVAFSASNPSPGHVAIQAAVTFLIHGPVAYSSIVKVLAIAGAGS
jgi:hypothetical protein